MPEKLKLFIWTGFYPNYSSGLAVAVAETEEEAKELVIEATNIVPDRCRYPEPGITNITCGNQDDTALTSSGKESYGLRVGG